MSNTAPSRADPVVVFPLGRWCPPQETSQPHPPQEQTQDVTYLSSFIVRLWLNDLEDIGQGPKVIMRDTPSSASDHLCLIWKTRQI